MKDNTDHDSFLKRLEKISSPLISSQDLKKLYTHLVRNSELSPESIVHEIESATARIGSGKYIFLAQDIDELSLTIEDISFLIEHNRYQEKEHSGAVGNYKNIDVYGNFADKHLFLISDSPVLERKTTETIGNIIRESRDKRFRLYSYVIISKPEKKDVRRMYILEQESAGAKDPAVVEKARKFVLGVVKEQAVDVRPEDVSAFIGSSTGGFVNRGLYNRKKKNIENYLFPWMAVRELIGNDEDLYISIEPVTVENGAAEKAVRLWLPQEKFQENFGTINKIFERRGIPISRQYFETFAFGERIFIALTTYIAGEDLTAEVEEFLKGELYNRLVLLQSAPLSVGEIRGILNRIKSARDYEKLDLIDVMQKNKHKEYLIPLVFMLNDHNDEIRNKAFGLIKHYLLNPTSEMKNDYYWSTLKNIMTAATVPLEREMDRPARPLTDMEIINLIKFRDIYYADYAEPRTGKQYLFIRINGIGIGKGGIRADAEHVSFSGEGALSTNMLFKTLGLGIPMYTTGKGGILGDLRLDFFPEKDRDLIRENVLNAYADFLYYKAGIGPLSDVPAGDVGIGGDEIGIIFKRITDNAFMDLNTILREGANRTSVEGRILRENFGINIEDAGLVRRLSGDRDKLESYTAAAITGKPGTRGLGIRAGATGRGLVEVLASQQNYNDFSDAALWSDPDRLEQAVSSDEEFYRSAYRRIRMLTFSVQGFGKVGASFASIIDGIGAKIKMISDISGTLVSETGVPHVSALCDMCKTGKCRLGDAPKELTDGTEFIPGETMWPLTAVVNVVVPSALEDVIINREKGGRNAVFVRNLEGEYLLQGANGPVTSDAEDSLSEMGLVSFPDILANSGGVLASYMEWLNGLIQVYGYGRMHKLGFVHPIVHNLVRRFHSGTAHDELRLIDEKVYEYSFKFIIRWATVETIRLSRIYKISMRSAYMALGIRLAAREGRLSGQFGIKIENMRDTFAARS